MDNGVLDEVYGRLSDTGPEFQGWLSNHGPMAADALLRLGRGEDLPSWLDAYRDRLEPAPTARWAIAEEEWRDPLGDPSRLGDWCALLHRQVREQPWEAVLERWWTRLLPGAVASAAHGLIRTGHAVRALREQVSAARLDELGRALAYWAARWQPLPSPGVPPVDGMRDPAVALDTVPAAALSGGIRARLATLGRDPAFSTLLAAAPQAPKVAQVPAALDALVDTAVGRYARWGHGNPVMLVHAATAPRAVALVVPSLPPQLWQASYHTAWAVTAALCAAYRPVDAAPDPGAVDVDLDDIVDRAVACADEHAIKFTEVAVQSHHRGNPAALPAADRAVDLIAAE